MPLWRERRLAVVHAVGSPDPTRSHFDAQDYMETGTPGRKRHPRRLAQQDRGPARARCQPVPLGGDDRGFAALALRQRTGARGPPTCASSTVDLPGARW
ncbi:MAG: hypothetical protein HC897_08985 [Thermoanaerobaculia bacterium]|nr:hypothetical protein [Thermoanaerobaculia bacterium]